MINCADIESMSTFWSAVLGLTPVSNDTAFRVLRGDRGNVGLQVSDDPVTYRHQMHFDIYCGVDERERECERVTRLGATHLRDSDDPNDPFVVFADPEGNEFCICPQAWVTSQ